MRNKFADVIYNESLNNPSICAVVADISPAGSMVKFREKFPDRFINCGVAEQSMIGIAAGLALRGMKPFCYTIATFSLYRPFEMVRVDLCYQNLPVTVIGMGAGIIYSTLGGTHHTIEDIAIASSLPNMTVLAPCDPLEMELATRWCVQRKEGPVYMRLGKAGEPNLTSNALEKFKVGKIRYLEKGKDIALISYGTILSLSQDIKSRLEKKGMSVSLISCHTIKPLDIEGIKKVLAEHSKVVIIEEHVPNGSLGSKIKEIAWESQLSCKIDSFSLKDAFIHFYGSYHELLEKHGISSDIIYNKICNS